ncbi:MAG TPA: hypothetical protein VFH51_01785, partial [Myxococcota bacterium]|nr:hypothetical protein [Myxococcota bacterium]
MEDEFAEARRAYQAQGWFVARLSPTYPGWYEYAPGHFYWNTQLAEVHVDARGENLFHPVALVSSWETGEDFYCQPCDSVEEAQVRAERAFLARPFHSG